MKSVLTTVAAGIMSLLAGCASQIMDGYVGGSIVNPMLDYGRPAQVFDLPDGRRAFQWEIKKTGAIPFNTPTTSTILGPGGWASVTTNSTTLVPFTRSCLYTLIGEERGQDWVVVSYRKPRLICE